MPWYSTGSVAVSAGSATVTGTGTAFSANGRAGDAFRGPDGRWYEITNIASATVLSIKPNYQGATASGQVYAIAPMQGYVKESADRLRQFVDQYGATLGSLGAWSTAATADAALNALGFSASGKTVATGTSAQARAALELVKQTSPTDTTAGSLMAVGAFGLGATSLGDILETAENWAGQRIKGWDSTAVGGPATTATSLGFDLGYAINRRFQLSITALNTLKFRYTTDPTIASNWRTVFNNANILGTVSQAGGVPTGAIIERGSNVNGEYVRFADGTQICLCSPAALLVTSVAAGAGFQGSNFTTFTYPAAFVVAPHPLFSTSYGGSGSRGWASIGSLTTTTVGLIAHSFSNDGNVVARPVLVGRWY